MRLLLVSVLGVTIAAIGCGRNDTVAGGAANPIGTTGTAAPGSSSAAAANAGSSAPAANGGSSAPAAKAGSSAPAAKAPAIREITIPAGTTLPVVLDTAVGSDTSRVEERISAHLARPIVVGGETALAAGSRVGGVVTDATRSAKVKGRAHVAVKFESVSPAGEDERYAMQTSSVGRTAAGTKQKDALEIGAPAAGGALIGALVGGKKGALIGGAVGGGAGTAVVMSTRGKEVHIPKGTALTLKLAAPLTVRVRG
jgi:hypothetical protein